jgi:murein DD-endopeptidase MepM/ murein hydrolase activator NlpD
MKDAPLAILRALAGLLFMRGAGWGASVLAVLALRPLDAALALLAMLAALALLRCRREPVAEEGTVIANAALVGIGCAALQAPIEVGLGAALLGAVVLVPVACALEAAARRSGGSSLSGSFTLVMWMLMLAIRGGHPSDAAWSWSTGSSALDAFVSSFGAVLYRSDVPTGLMLAALVLARSRIIAVCAFAGHLGGCLARLLWAASSADALGAPDGLNSTLAGMAVGAALLVPGPPALLGAVGAGAVAALIAKALSIALLPLGLPPLTAPLAIAAFLAVRTAALIAPTLLPVVVEDTPEATLAHHAALRRRLNGRGWDIALPVAGRWSVWQGEDGPWTHRGPWRHAIDLVLRDDEGHLHAHDGRALTDWHAFGKPVLAPIDGTVVALVDGIADNPIGQVDSARNWGNAIVIADPRGFHVELSHLRCGSPTVAVGQWVARGQPIAQCGNSGCSAQPHLHVQAQALGRIGDHTIPFRFGAHHRDGELVLDGLPGAGSAIEAVTPEPRRARALDLVPGERLRFRCGDDVGFERIISLRAGRALDGSLTLESERGRLILGLHAGSLRIWRREGHDPQLALLHAALPSLPLCRLDGLTWRDWLPVTALVPGWRGQLLAALALVAPRFAYVAATLRGVADDRVRCTIEAGPLRPARRYEVRLDDEVGIAAVAGESRRLARVANHPTTASAAALPLAS